MDAGVVKVEDDCEPAAARVARCWLSALTLTAIEMRK